LCSTRERARNRGGEREREREEREIEEREREEREREEREREESERASESERAREPVLIVIYGKFLLSVAN